MIWKNIMLTSCEDPMFNWKQVLTEVNVERFKDLYLDPASGYVSHVCCPNREVCDHDGCSGLKVRDLYSGTTACCTQFFGGLKIPISEGDLIRYTLSYPRFHAELCRQLKLNFSNLAIGDFFWELGTHKLGTGRFVPVYISYYITQAQLTEKLKEILVDPKTKFALILFDYSMISRSMAKILEERKCIYVSMSDLFSFNEDCTLNLLTTSEHVFGLYKENTPVLQQTYQCESGTEWSDIYIKYKDKETISVWKRGSEAHPYSYIALNMVDRRKHTPNKAFNFFNELLKKESNIIPVPPESNPHYSELIKRKSEINKALNKFFVGINDKEPLKYDPSTHSYRVKMQIKSLLPNF